MLQVPAHLRRGHRRDEEASIASAVALLEHVCRILDVNDLGGVDVLDVGCGVKFTQALLNHDLPIGRYVGVDVHAGIIEYLAGHVADPRFEFHHVDIHNELYNPTGVPLSPESRLPIGDDERFDAIVLFSVFTHLAPHDFSLMLRMLRHYAQPDSRLVFSLYIDERTLDGHGLMDKVASTLGEESVGRTETFRDARPEKPLDWALYSREYATALIEGTGWFVVSLEPPTPVVQHHFVCRPAAPT